MIVKYKKDGFVEIPKIIIIDITVMLKLVLLFFGKIIL